MTAATVRVLDGGLQTTIQDADGRPGLGRFGVAPGGAMDRDAARLANRLVGDRDDAPVLEITLHGPTLVWDATAHVGLAGADLGAVSEHLRLAPGFSFRLDTGSILRFEPSLRAGRGARAYLAVAGGFVVDRVLGSAATDRRSGFGGIEGRELRAGDVLTFGADQAGPLRAFVRGHQASPVDPDAPVEVRVIPAPSVLGWFGPDALRELTHRTWAVAGDSDRNGIRLTGDRVASITDRIASLGVPVGSVQVPPSGQPIVTMVDGPVTGGYPVLGVVPRLDHGRLAQLAPGATLRFRTISVDAARELEAAVAESASRDRVEVEPGELGASWAR